MANETFKRVEVKYRLSEEQYIKIRERLKDYFEDDEYGLSTISSIYYDTDSYDIIRESLEKPVYKEKLRLRAYGSVTEDSKVFLELKKKYDGIVYKRRIGLGYKEAMDYLERGIRPQNDSQILREIDYFLKFHKPTTGTYVAYERIATFGKENKDLRITFDKDIRIAFDRKDLVEGKSGEYILNPGERLMEIKVPGAMPLWLAEILSELKIYPSSFSKYGAACKRYLAFDAPEGNRKAETGLTEGEACDALLFITRLA